MKKLFLIIFSTFSVSIYAENWLNQSKIKSGSIEAYSLKSDCEKISNEKCYDLGDYPSSVFSEIDVEVDDASKPLYSKNEVQSCATVEICQSINASKICSIEGETPIVRLDTMEIYCSRLVGYEKKLEKSIALDQTKLSQWQAQKAIEAQAGQKEAGVQLALRKIECGKRVIALLVLRNAPKGLTTSQVAQLNSVYAPIKGLLETASLVTAKEQILAVSADGVIITEADKTDLANETQKCIELQ